LNFKVWFLVFSSSLLVLPVCSANNPPTAEDVNRLDEKAKLTADTFMQQSFKLRMQYEYSGKFLTSDNKENLHKLAKNAGDKLQTIANKQETLKQQIEYYQGDDWDQRYGSTGLWRKLSADLYRSTLSKCQIDFYLALAAEQPQKNMVLHKILREVDRLSQTYKQFGPQLVKAKVLSLLAQTEPAYKAAAIKELDAFKFYSDVSKPIKAAVEKIKLVGSAEPNELKALARCLGQNRHAGELELILPLLFLQRKYAPVGFEEAVQTFPETTDFLGSIIFLDILSMSAEHQDLEQLSVFETELAAQAIWRNNVKDYKTLLGHLAGIEKFQTPLILYVTAAAFAETSPDKAVELLIKASNSQRLQKNSRLDIEPDKIAAQAAQLAYNLFVEYTNNCSPAIKAFENYQQIAAAKIDQKLEYLYTIVLNGCDRSAESEKMLEKIAARPKGIWRNRAKLDLIIHRMAQTGKENKGQYNKLLEELRDFILNYHAQDKNSNSLRREAITMYCQLLLEMGDGTSAQKVLNILDKAEEARGIQFDFFKAKAFQQTGELEQAVHYMVTAITLDSGSLAPEVTQLLSEVVDKIEHLQSQADNFNKMIDDCRKLANFSYVSLNDRQSAMLFAEISILAAEKDNRQLSEAERLLRITVEDGAGDIDSIRCRARLLREQGKLEQAAKLWLKICQKRKDETPSDTRRNWKWWRAKYYELDCWAKSPQTKKEDVLHTIEILENSFTETPPLWAKKLMMLRQYCRSRTINAGK